MFEAVWGMYLRHTQSSHNTTYYKEMQQNYCENPEQEITARYHFEASSQDSTLKLRLIQIFEKLVNACKHLHNLHTLASPESICKCPKILRIYPYRVPQIVFWIRLLHWQFIVDNIREKSLLTQCYKDTVNPVLCSLRVNLIILNIFCCTSTNWNSSYLLATVQLS